MYMILFCNFIVTLSYIYFSWKSRVKYLNLGSCISWWAVSLLSKPYVMYNQHNVTAHHVIDTLTNQLAAAYRTFYMRVHFTLSRGKTWSGHGGPACLLHALPRYWVGRTHGEDRRHGMKLASQKTLILEQTVNLVIPGVNLAILAWLVSSGPSRNFTSVRRVVNMYTPIK